MTHWPVAAPAAILIFFGSCVQFDKPGWPDTFDPSCSTSYTDSTDDVYNCASMGTVAYPGGDVEKVYLGVRDDRGMTVSVRLIYGGEVLINGSYAYVDSESEAFDKEPLGALVGELGGGGAGTDYLLHRFDLTDLRSYCLPGASATIDLYTFADSNTGHDWYILSDDLMTLSWTFSQ